MKSYEEALEALKAKYEAQTHAVGDLRAKAIDFIDACEKAPVSARNELKTVIKTSESLFRGKDLSGIFGGLER